MAPPIDWKRATWTFSPVDLSHTKETVTAAFRDFLLDVGFENVTGSTASGGSGDYYLLDGKRFTIDLENDSNGSGGNVAITHSEAGAVITTNGMSGGDGASPARGDITITGQVTDGDTITISDGTTSVTFEFDNDATVGAGNISVAIGSTFEVSLQNLHDAINAHAFDVTSFLNDLWWYDGDGVVQHCGLLINADGATDRVDVIPWLQNQNKDDSQRLQVVAHRIQITLDMTLDNEFLFVGGREGFYVEAGKAGEAVNVGHGAVLTFQPNPDLHSDRDHTRRWFTQGAGLQLFGAIPFTDSRSYRFVDDGGSDKNITAALQPHIVRGYQLQTDGNPRLDLQSQVDDPKIGVSNRDVLFSLWVHNNVTESLYIKETFGVPFAERDDVFRISPVVVLPTGGPTSAGHAVASGVVTGSTDNNVAPDTSIAIVQDVRAVWDVPRFAATSSSLLPFNQITDQVTGIPYRIAQVDDDGRQWNMAIEWPGDTVSIAATPS